MNRPAKLPNLMEQLAEALSSGRVVYSGHANLRLHERKVTKPEVELILRNGFSEAWNDRFNSSFGSWDYSVSGLTVDGRKLRVIVCFEDLAVLIVTIIDLTKKD